MFRCFFDEGGGEDHGFIAVCGYVASFEQWKRFETEWKKCWQSIGFHTCT
jgi:hypothetical protein